MPNLINNNLKLNYSIMKTCSQNNHFAPIRANKLNKTDMSMILQGLAPEENYTNIQMINRNPLRPNLTNLKPIRPANFNRVENTYNVLI